jgi:wobble nucleotide-excising tRNase
MVACQIEGIMIKKVISLKNLGKFESYKASGDVEFRKLTVIYGENGRGKTTLAAVFHSLQSQNPDYIFEKQTLGQSSPPTVDLRLENGNAAFRDGRWSITLPELEIFDSAFINENVFSGDYVGHDHRKNLYHFALGTQGVRLATRIEEIDQESREVTTALREKENEIRRAGLVDMALDAFLNLATTDDVEDRINSKEAEIETVKRAKEVLEKPPLSTLSYPDLPTDRLKALLQRSLAEVHLDAEERIRRHIVEHTDQGNEEWIQQGLRYIITQTCPFCGSDLTGNELLAAYRVYFSQAYENLKNEVEALIQEITRAWSSEVFGHQREKVTANKLLSEFWANHASIKCPSIDVESLQRGWDGIRKAAVTYLRRKATSPLEPILLGADWESVLTVCSADRDKVWEYNNAVTAANIMISERKHQLHVTVVKTLEDELVELRCSKLRHSDPMAAICVGYQELQRRKEALESERKKAKPELDNHTASMLGTYQDCINTYLRKFGADFRIAGAKTSFAGGKPSATYYLEIDQQRVNLGDEKTSGQPCFKSALSDGDKNALAFAFFLAKLDQDPDPALSMKVIVIDDPINSLDAHRITCTQQAIVSLTRRARQVVLLSHNAQFLRSVWDNVPDNESRTLYLGRNGRRSSIQEWDIAIATQSDYFRDYFTLDDYAASGSCEDPRNIARSIRPVLEGYLRVRYPKDFKSNEWLGGFIQKIRKAPNESPLQHLVQKLDDLSAVNEYSAKYHHQSNPAADSEPLNEAELQAFVKRVLNLIHML